MRFLLHCPVTASALPAQLGTAEYSYRFVLEGFRSVLERLGEVIEIDEPHRDAPRLRAEAAAAGRACRLFCFCPPNRGPVGLDCPTTVVLAWEFDSIPTQAWEGDARNDWRTVLRDHGQAITLSTHSRDTILRALPNGCVVTAVPVPVYERFAGTAGTAPAAGVRPRTVAFSGRAIDAHAVDLAAGRVYPNDPLSMRTRQWDGHAVQLTFEEGGEGTLYLLGFYEPEPWGTWSRATEPAILLPYAISGDVNVSLELRAYGPNAGREIELGFGRERHAIVLTEHPATHTFTVKLREPVNLIRLGRMDLSPVAGSTDNRTMGIGLVSLTLSPERRRWWMLPRRVPVLPKPKAEVALAGVVFTTMLNPRDGRKNWTDILTAFCHALGDRADATLVIKMTHFSVASFLGELLTKLEEIGPIRARVLALHGFLDDDEYRQLITATSWYVNASHGEGLCLPLMEFMSAGVPAIAPSHTAMADYVDERSTLIVGASRMPTRWPNDPLHRLRTRYYRIDWESLAGRFREAYAIATGEPDRYAAMSTAAETVQRDYASLERVTMLLQRHLEHVA